MSEHGVPESRLIVIKQEEDYVSPQGQHYAQYICECLCKNHTSFVAMASKIKSGDVLSCGCLQKERTSNANKKYNKRDLSGDYGIIWSNNTNEEIYFDLDDAENILKYCWYVNKKGYAVTSITTSTGKQKTITMHKMLGYKHPDHHNRNKLDNRKDNLYICTQQENCRNKSLHKNNTSGVTGVNWNSSTNNWVARINDDNKRRIYLGCYNDKEDAIRVRLQAELEYYGDFAPQRHLFKQYNINPS